MLNVDISNIWCSVTLPQLLEREPEIAGAHAALTDAKGSDFLDWLDRDWELERLQQTAAAIRGSSQALVIVGDDSAVLGVRAAVELVRGSRHALRPGLQLLFAGGDLSPRAWLELTELLEEKDFSVHLVGRGGGEPQTAVTVRALRWLLERRYGSDKARERVYVTTDPTKGFLRQLSLEEGYRAFNLDRTLAGHASVLAPGALLGAAAAGLDIEALLDGAAAARTAMAVRSFENPAWLYAAGRRVLAARGRRVEYLSAAEPDAWTLCRWWQRLMGGRACPDGEGLIPAAAELPAELPQLHGLLACGRQPIVQTILRFAPPAQRIPVEMDWKNLDGLNSLEGFTLDYVQEQAVAGAIQAGVDGGVPIMTVDCGAPDEAAAGELFYFFELTSCLCAGMLGRSPYADDPPAEWVKNFHAFLEEERP